MTLLPIDGPGTHGVLTVTSTAQEVKLGASAQAERKMISMQPTDGSVYFGYDNTVSSTTGTRVFRWQLVAIEVGPDLPLWVVAASGDTVNVRVTEAS